MRAPGYRGGKWTVAMKFVQIQVESLKFGGAQLRRDLAADLAAKGPRSDVIRYSKQ